MIESGNYMVTRRNMLKAAGLVALGRSANSIANSESLIGKPIPSSGVNIPLVGIGTNRYGVEKNTQAYAELEKVIAAFSEVTGGVIDTAPGYGRSEQVLGGLISDLDLSEKFFVATKCDVKGAEATRNQVAHSQTLMHSGTLDLVAVHNLRNWKAQLEVLRELKEKGEIAHIGITTSRLSQHQEFAKVMLSEQLDFVQLNYSLVDRNADKRLLNIAADRGIAVMVNLPFGRRKVFQHAGSSPLPEWAGELGIFSWAQYALKYIVSHPAVNCAIPGTRKLKHLEDNLRASAGPQPSMQQRQAMEQYFDQL
jgi:aryl-alcohol dehydrogenase-like predicted oxidoreductase